MAGNTTGWRCLSRGRLLVRALFIFGITLLVGGSYSAAISGSNLKFHAQASAPTSPAVKVKTRINPKDGAVMVLILAGPFKMGDADQPYNPRHTVKLSAYWIYKNDVTVAEYRKFCAATGRTMPDAPAWGWVDDNPVVNVSWPGAMAYAKWAGMDLPTEAQWEKAARGTDGRKYPWGNEWDTSRCANNDTGDAINMTPGRTCPVGIYMDSPYGLSDMAGNVRQWCKDKFDEQFWTSAGSKRTDPVNEAGGDYHVCRGGCFSYITEYLFRCSSRDHIGVTDDRTGFRCAARASSN